MSYFYDYILRIIRAFLGLIALLMPFTCYGFINSLGGFSNVINKFDAFIDSGLAMTFFSYVCIGIFCFVIFLLLGRLINKLYLKQNGVVHPTLSKKFWAL